MKLWILRPIKENELWEPWYDKAFGHIVRAEDETTARELAAEENGNEGKAAWLSNGSSTCVELSAVGEAGVVMTDFAAA